MILEKQIFAHVREGKMSYYDLEKIVENGWK
jgi:hypothetical protein